MKNIAVLGTFDTKGEEHAFVAECIRREGFGVLTIDVGTLDPPRFQPDIDRHEIARAAGADLGAVLKRRDRGEAVAVMVKGAPMVVAEEQRAGTIHGIISLGGGGGTAICTSAMRALPIGFPKLMVSTLASGNTAPYLGVKDIVMMPSVADVAGLNRLSRMLLAQAAGAICGMVRASGANPAEVSGDKPLIVASQFGNTTACVTAARGRLEAEGYEVMVFAATGTGGRTMESIIESGVVDGVLDITTTEWADEHVGGVLTAGPTRCEAAAKLGVPAILTPGCLDMVNFGEPSSVPARFAHRKFYHHNPQVTLMRTTPEECSAIGAILATKANLSTAPVSILVPLQGISVISAPGQPFHDPAADRALFDAWKKGLRPDIRWMELDCNINDPRFAEACVTELLANIRKHQSA